MKHLTILLLLICSISFGQTCAKFDKFYDYKSKQFKYLDVEICILNEGKGFRIYNEIFTTQSVEVIEDDPVYVVKDSKGEDYFIGLHFNPKSISLYSVKSKDMLFFTWD